MCFGHYGVGVDYYSYEKIYNTLHGAKFNTYFSLHLLNRGYYYVEIGYYFLNRLANNYHVLRTIGIVVIFIAVIIALKDYRGKMNIGLAVFVFLSTQFIYSMNAARFSVALAFVLLSYKYIIKEDLIRFIICMIIAACFHKTALFCVALYFLQEFNLSYINKVRNMLMMIAILFFPFISQYLFDTFKELSVFARYFSSTRYASSEVMDIGIGWMLHILPVIIPLLIFGWRYIKDSKENRTLFRIYLMNIPFRMLGLYNTWYTRFARYSQAVEVLFIPLVLYRIPSKKVKKYLTIYYIVWYINEPALLHSIKILHILHYDIKFTVGYVNFMKIKMTEWDHTFIIAKADGKVECVNNDNVYIVNNFYEMIKRRQLKEVIKNANIIIISGVFSSYTAVSLFKKKDLNKIFLHFWGADFYDLREQSKSIREKIKNMLKVYCCHKCAGLIFLIEGEYDKFREIVHVEKNYFIAPMPGDPLVRINYAD